MAIVVGAFQQHLGTDDELPPTSRLLEDLGVDSVALVTILMDLADELALDLSAAGAKLRDIRALADIVSLVESLSHEHAG